MDKICTVSLISQTHTRDAIGQDTVQETVNSCICTVLSVTRAEFAAVQQKSLSPSYVLRVFFADYSGEKLAEFQGHRYEIYRVYAPGDYIELYLGEKVGELRE